MSALKKDPKNKKDNKGFQVGTDAQTLAQQQAVFQKRVDAGKTGKAVKNLAAVNKAIGALGTDPGQNPQPAPTQAPTPQNTQGFTEATDNANSYLNNVFGQLQNQGQFNPGDYTQMRQQASDVAMNEFNRQNSARFAQEDANFEQQMAEQGIDPNSEKYRYLKGQNDLSRQNAIQGAQNNAFQMGQSEQAQAYGQAANTYNMPLNQLNAMSPYYGYQNQANLQQGQQNWAAGQNQLDRDFTAGQTQGGYDFQREMAKLQQKYALQLQNNAPRGGGGGGGGGLTYDQQLGLIDRNFYNNMVLSGMQNGQQVPLPGVGSGVSQGVGVGVGVGLGAGLR